jgi:hypothetical protein
MTVLMAVLYTLPHVLHQCKALDSQQHLSTQSCRQLTSAAPCTPAVGITDDPHGFMSSWQPGSKPCGSPQWIGVQCTCNTTTCHITGIDLGSAGMKGTLSPAIGTLSQLKVLWVNGNRFSGQVPDTVGNLEQMTGWSSRGNQFSGPLPVTIEKLTKLEYLLAQYNFHSGPLPEQLGKLKQLDWINLAFNQFSGGQSAERLVLPSNDCVVRTSLAIVALLASAVASACSETLLQ